mgnify:CR=1 FL=1
MVTVSPIFASPPTVPVMATMMALMNRKLADDVTTVFLMPHEKYTYLNSTIVREIARLGGDVSDFVPPGVRRRLLEKVR